jgi:hypothetical protein
MSSAPHRCFVGGASVLQLKRAAQALRYAGAGATSADAAMGFLDDLKKQAGSLQARENDGQQSLARSTQLVEAAARGAQRYLMELAGHLDVIRPPARHRYVLDKQVVVEALPMVDFRYDARRKILREQEVIDHVVMGCSLRSGRRVQLSKDFVNEMEQLERRLAQAVIAFEREPVRHPDNGKLIEVRYGFVADVALSVQIRCEHDSGMLHFSVRNLDGLESVECEFPAHEVGQARLDELARWWVGEPHRFLDGAVGLRRIEAR